MTLHPLSPTGGVPLIERATRGQKPKGDVKQNAPERSKAADDVHPGDTSDPTLLLRHEEHLLPGFDHVVGVHRDVFEDVRLDVRVEGRVDLEARTAGVERWQRAQARPA